MDALVLGTRFAGDDEVAIARTTDKEKDTVFDGWVQFEM